MDKEFIEERLQALKDRARLQDVRVDDHQAIQAGHERQLRRQQKRVLGLEMKRCALQINGQDDQPTAKKVAKEKNFYQKLCQGGTR
ncbi:hypothetical protein [Streptococcus sp. NLN64]|uniref:hypothetical protein n=1 Tax=Streptococcus sp. NLN64 TaxID=2822799 RepID=UPI0018C97483|nr:hypothetical protein [Streptococcus sp. NLN64]MBG9367803.1 hypothetical protein [Streptococcus sp. NLN64]